MQSLLKTNLNGRLKRLVSTLICLMMVLATFPMHMFKDTVCAGGGTEQVDSKTATVEITSLNGMLNLPANPSLTKNQLQSKNKILINLKTDVDIDSIINGRSHLFDFSDSKYSGKTIIINGNNKIVKISTPDVFALNVSGCKVILKNITIDGANLSRDGAFINIFGQNLTLEIGEGATIQNCKNQGKPGKDGKNGARGEGGRMESGWRFGCKGVDGSNGENGKDALGGAIYCENATVKLAPGAVIENCSVIGGDGGNGGNGGQGGNGGAIYVQEGRIDLVNGIISNCSASG